MTFYFLPSKKETESPPEKVKRKKRQGTATALKVTFHGPSKLGQRSAGTSPSGTYPPL